MSHALASQFLKCISQAVASYLYHSFHLSMVTCFHDWVLYSSHQPVHDILLTLDQLGFTID